MDHDVIITWDEFFDGSVAGVIRFFSILFSLYVSSCYIKMQLPDRPSSTCTDCAVFILILVSSVIVPDLGMMSHLSGY